MLCLRNERILGKMEAITKTVRKKEQDSKDAHTHTHTQECQLSTIHVFCKVCMQKSHTQKQAPRFEHFTDLPSTTQNPKGNLWETQWSAYVLFQLHRYHLELNWDCTTGEPLALGSTDPTAHAILIFFFTLPTLTPLTLNSKELQYHVLFWCVF